LVFKQTCLAKRLQQLSLKPARFPFELLRVRSTM
jgi:hypothetical protein